MSTTEGVQVASSHPGGITDINLARQLISDTVVPQQAPPTAQPVAPDGHPAHPPIPAIFPQTLPPQNWQPPGSQPAPAVVAPVVVAPVVAPQPAMTADALRNRLSGTPQVVLPGATDSASPVVPEVPPGIDPSKPESKQQLYTWATLRTERNQFHKELQEKTEAVKAIEAEKVKLAEEKATIEAERQKLAQERDTYVEQLGKVSLAESPEFKQRYDTRLDEIQRKMADDLVRHTGVKAEDAMAEAYNLLVADPKQLAEMLKDNPMVLGRVMTRAEEAAAIYQMRDEELKKWRETSAALGIQTARDQVVKSTESRRQWADMAIDLAKQSGHPIFSAIEGPMLEQAAQIQQAVHGFVQSATEEELTRAAVEGYANPFLYEAFNKMAEENRVLRDRLEGGYRSATPPLFPFAGAPPAMSAPVTPSNVQLATPSDGPQAFLADVLANIGRR